jgi:hypothetical protein
MEQPQFHIVRAEKAGVFLCRILSSEGSAYTVSALRRLYYWSGALDVSMLAKEGVSNPRGCKFSVQMGEDDRSTILNVIEVHPVSEKALSILNSVPVWKQ